MAILGPGARPELMSQKMTKAAREAGHIHMRSKFLMRFLAIGASAAAVVGGGGIVKRTATRLAKTAKA